MFQDTVQGTRRDVHAGLPRNSDCTGFAWMMELTMVAPRPHEMLAVRFNHLYQVSHFHTRPDPPAWFQALPSPFYPERFE